MARAYGIDEQFVRVEAQPFARRIAAVDAVAVQLARPDALQVGVPHVARLLGQRDAGGLFAVDVVEQAQLDAGGVLGEDGEVGALAIPGRAQRVGATGPDR